VTGDSGPSAPSDGRLGLEAEREVQRELDDALYYLGTDCGPCAERHFVKARLLGATEEAIAAVLAKHAADPTARAAASPADPH
jgi:hypothetical protein